MNISAIFKAILSLVTAAILGISGTHNAAVAGPAVVASTTDSVMEQVIASKPTTTPADDQLKQAYEIGKAVGQLQEKVRVAAEPKAVPTPEPQQLPAPVPAPTPAQVTPQPMQTQPEPMQPSQPAPAPVEQPQPAAVPQSQARIEIVSPIAGKGLGRNYVAAPEAVDESNYIELGAIVYGDGGVAEDNVIVSVTATDASQNKNLNGTGNVMKVFRNGQGVLTPVYPFHYEFHTPGDHTITFTTGSGNANTQSVTLNVK